MCDTKMCLNCTLPYKCDQCQEGYVLAKGECVSNPTRSRGGAGGDNGTVLGKCH